MKLAVCVSEKDLEAYRMFALSPSSIIPANQTTVEAFLEQKKQRRIDEW